MTAESPLDYLFGLEQHGIKLALDNIRTLCAALDHPERAFASVIVAGTNGKGSVTTMIETALRAGGLTTGRFYLAPLGRVGGALRVERMRRRPTCTHS